jgi:UDP-N-acetylmuramyl tripeptide synthase
LLAKNPAGFAAAFEALPPGDEPLYIAINARVADGLDPSWLYDVPFELLRGRLVYCAGDRALDLATRLHYAGVSATLSAPPTVDIDMWAIANYTAFADWLRESSPC